MTGEKVREPENNSDIESPYVDSWEQVVLYMGAYESFIINHPKAIALWDPEGNFMAVSKEYQRLFGEHIDIGQNVLDIFSDIPGDPYHGPRFHHYFNKAVSGENITGTDEYRGLRLRWNYYPFLYRPDVFGLKYCIFVEINELKDGERIEIEPLT